MSGPVPIRAHSLAFRFSISRVMIATIPTAVLALNARSTEDTLGIVPFAMMLTLISLFIDWSEWSVSRGRNAMNRGDFQVALAAFDRSIAARPDVPERYDLRGWTHYLLDQLDEAESDFSQSLSMKRDNAVAWIGRALISNRRNDITSQEVQHTLALCIAPNDHSIRYYSGVLLAADRPGEAIAELTHSIQIQPTCYAFSSRASLYLAQRRYDEAVSDCRAARNLGDCSAGNRITYLLAIYKQWRFDEAFDGVRRLLETAPTCEDATIVFAWFLSTCPENSRRDGHAALRLLDEIKNVQNSYFYASALAASHAEIGDLANAVVAAESALGAAPTSHKDLARLRLGKYQAGHPVRDPPTSDTQACSND